MLSGGWTGQSTVGRWIVFLVIIRSFMFAIKKLELVELSFLAGRGLDWIAPSTFHCNYP